MFYIHTLVCDGGWDQAALTYAEAQMRIDDRSMNDEVTLGLRRLNELAKILKHDRQQNGSVMRGYIYTSMTRL